MNVARALVLAAVLAAAPAWSAAPDAAYTGELAQWRAKADRSLTRERGWLSIVSRDELTPGTYTIGSAPDNRILLPKGLAPAHLGTVIAGNDKARLVLAKGQAMRTVAKDDEGEAFTERDLVTGATRLEWVTSGRLSLQFVKREDGRIVVRAADRESPRRTTFAGRQWYEPKPRVQGRRPLRAEAERRHHPDRERARRDQLREGGGHARVHRQWPEAVVRRARRRRRPLHHLPRRHEQQHHVSAGTLPGRREAEGRRLGRSTSTRPTTRPARSPPTPPVRCRRRKTG